MQTPSTSKDQLTPRDPPPTRITSEPPVRPDWLQGLSCATCTHLGVCAIIKAIAPLMKEWADPLGKEDDKTKRPFEPEQLAMICKRYSSDVVAKLMNGDDHS